MEVDSQIARRLSVYLALVALLLSAATREAFAMTQPALYAFGTAAYAGDVAVTLRSVEIETPAPSDVPNLRHIRITCEIRNLSSNSMTREQLPALVLEARNGTHQEVAGQVSVAGIAQLPAKGVLTATAVFLVPEFDPKTWLLRVGDVQGPRIVLQ